MILSIITINYNNKVGLEKTIKSVVSQTVMDKIEYIIIDGGSTDGSKQVIFEYESNLSYWVSESDKGVYNAMNKGIVHSNGDFLLFLNSGDCLTSPNVISKVICEIQNSGAILQSSIFIGKINIVKNNRAIGTRWCDSKIIHSPYMMLFSSIPHQAAFIPKELMKTYMYDEQYKIISDWKFFLESVTFGDANVINMPMLISDYDASGISSRSYSEQLDAKEKIILSMLPSSVAEDYKRVVDLKTEYYKVNWILSHNWFKKMLFLFVGFIMKLGRN